MTASRAPAPPSKFHLLPEAIAWKIVERVRDLFGREERLQVARSTDALARERLQQLTDQATAQERLTLSRADRQTLQALVESEVLGYGPLDALLGDPSVHEIMVNGPKRTYVERAGQMEETAITFRDSDHVMRIIERILHPLGRQVDESSPMVDARLPDGSRVNIVVPPLSLIGPTITIRKFEREALTIDDLIELETINPPAAAFLAACVRGRLNIIVAGGTATGKTTFMNVLSAYIPAGERVLTIEDSAELQLHQRHIVALESRPPNIEGKGEVAIRDLVINALRMRPDRIIVGECRGSEALDMLQAMNTGHEGSMTTLHANDPEEAILRLQTMVLLAGTELPSWAIQEQIGEAIQLIVQMERLPSGRRVVTRIVELGRRVEDKIEIRPLFTLSEEQGKLVPTGELPRLLERLKERGIELPLTLFAGPPDDPAAQSFVAAWLHRQDPEPPPPPLGTRLDWTTRYRISDKVKDWLVGQVAPGEMVRLGPEATRLMSRGLDIVLGQENMVLARNDRQVLQTLVESEVLGYGPLDPLLADAEISEVMVNGPDLIYVERKGKVEETAVAFRDREHLMRIVERILSPLGRRVDESTPYVDARLPDGSRVNIIIPPLSLLGPVVTIRKFEREALTIADMIDFGTLTPQVADFLSACVLGRLNIVVSGGTGSGKTTLLNVLSSFIPDTERIVTIENAAELRLNQRHVISLESRPPNVEGRGEITIRNLVINALRMRPDRIVVGEVRGGEALDMLQTMSTGSSLTTLHANDPREALLRLETMVMLAGFDLPIRAIREQISLAIDLFVHLRRMPDGKRRIVQISEVVGLQGREVLLQDIYRFHPAEVRGDEVLGELEPTGVTPRVLEKLHRRQIPVRAAWFE
jgi:pilus assembly protein CpaF